MITEYKGADATTVFGSFISRKRVSIITFDDWKDFEEIYDEQVVFELMLKGLLLEDTFVCLPDSFEEGITSEKSIEQIEQYAVSSINHIDGYLKNGKFHVTKEMFEIEKLMRIKYKISLSFLGYRGPENAHFMTYRKFDLC